MTPPDLTQPQRLDLEEGKRLLSEEQAMQEQIRALPPDTPVVVFHGPSDVTELHKWLRNNADALVAAAEEAEKLRELLREARDVMDVARGNALLSDGEWLSDCIDAALTPPEPAQQTPQPQEPTT